MGGCYSRHTKKMITYHICVIICVGRELLKKKIEIFLVLCCVERHELSWDIIPKHFSKNGHWFCITNVNKVAAMIRYDTFRLRTVTYRKKLLTDKFTFRDPNGDFTPKLMVQYDSSKGNLCMNSEKCDNSIIHGFWMNLGQFLKTRLIRDWLLGCLQVYLPCLLNYNWE